MIGDDRVDVLDYGLEELLRGLHVRDIILFPTFIEAAEPTGTRVGTVNAEGLTGRTVISGFTIRGYDVTSRPASGLRGFNSYAMYVNVPGGLTVQNNHFVGGRGGDATPSAPGTAGANGGNGTDGLPSKECNTPQCSGESQAGGPGGANVACPGQTSGNPGGGVNPQSNPQQYASGANGNGQGGIQQTFDTVAGVLYNVSFWLAGNPDGAPVTKSVLVGASGADSATYSFTFTGFDKANMGWKNYTYSFVAASSSTTLSFASKDATSFGAALDNVSVAAVPEPATWAMMILGFGLVGGSMRRRRAILRPLARLVRA